jgi:hypothetical protein
VLWKAVQVLTSALTSMQSNSTDQMFEFIFSEEEYLRHKDSQLLFNNILTWCDIMLTTVNIYHPIIVVQCPVYGWDGRGLTKIHHVRLLRETPGGRSHWCDVVQMEGIDQFLQHLTKHYANLVPEGLERLRPHLGMKRKRHRRSRT